MSILQYPDAMNVPDLQIWNNAAFDNEESEGSAAIKASWSNLQPSFLNRSSESLRSDCSKENFSPVFAKTPFSLKSSVPTKPLHPNTTIENSQGKPLKKLVCEEEEEEDRFEPLWVVAKKGFLFQEEEAGEKVVRDETKIDSEIEEIEKEITRLNSRLETLRLEKAERNKTTKTIDKREKKIVAAKFMESAKQSVKNSDGLPPSSTSKTKLYRRGMSLGPSEIVAGTGLRRLSRHEITTITPIQPIQSRRKSCFWKLQDIDELRVTKERRKSLSLSPKSRKIVPKIQPPKQALTSVSSKRPVKKEDGVIASVQPKKLFKDGEKSAPTAKKPVKPGRVIPSRYNQIAGKEATTDVVRKRSLPEDDKEENGKRCDKKRMSLVGKGRVKKRWEIPSEVVVYQSGVVEDNNNNNNNKTPLLSAADMENVLPKIKNLRCVNESPRDSGPAKRVAELIGRKSFFRENLDVVVEDSVCQALSFAEEENAEEK
ncbi:hypothetical protein FEM48_Zijuj04G0076600 [Ziziphus jujuba var. spinosa]|uniref:Uncharacterized protein n=1 Tax=Ziziphus jujuba var. spinosa TaxID=714518 RepID=A0A978VIM0_ZIZJJ|nr:hypothetical protein FEM48_Zijuj04G0076600 [Ziziphus jujuba var. spinosa]